MRQSSLTNSKPKRKVNKVRAVIAGFVGVTILSGFGLAANLLCDRASANDTAAVFSKTKNAVTQVATSDQDQQSPAVAQAIKAAKTREQETLRTKTFDKATNSTAQQNVPIQNGSESRMYNEAMQIYKDYLLKDATPAMRDNSYAVLVFDDKKIAPTSGIAQEAFRQPFASVVITHEKPEIGADGMIVGTKQEAKIIASTQNGEFKVTNYSAKTVRGIIFGMK